MMRAPSGQGWSRHGPRHQCAAGQAAGRAGDSAARQLRRSTRVCAGRRHRRCDRGSYRHRATLRGAAARCTADRSRPRCRDAVARRRAQRVGPRGTRTRPDHRQLRLPKRCAHRNAWRDLRPRPPERRRAAGWRRPVEREPLRIWRWPGGHGTAAGCRARRSGARHPDRAAGSQRLRRRDQLHQPPSRCRIACGATASRGRLGRPARHRGLDQPAARAGRSCRADARGLAQLRWSMAQPGHGR